MDIRRLLEDCDAETVAESIGLDITIKGKYKYILCPGHQTRLGKPDSHVGNAVLWERGYYCFACGCFVNTHDMVMEYMNCTSSEAYEVMAMAMGGVSLYEGTQTDVNIPRLRLTKEEAGVIGLSPNFHTLILQKETAHGTVKVYDGLYDLYQKNKRRYYQLIRDKAKESLDKYLYLKEHYASMRADMAYMIYDLMGETFDNGIYKKMEWELDSRIEICERIIRLFGKKTQEPAAN